MKHKQPSNHSNKGKVTSEGLALSEEMSNATDGFGVNIVTLQSRMSIAALVISGLAFVLGFFGNGLVIFITGFRMKKTVNTIWFLNLAIADFIFIFSMIFTRAAVFFKWTINQFFCKMNNTLFLLNLYTSVYILTVISIDRCIFVRHPVWAQNYRKPRQASFVALGVWILALVLSSPPLYFTKSIQNKCFNAYGYTVNTQQSRHRDVIISRFIFAFIIPFTVIFLCYWAIVLRLRSSQFFQSSKPYRIITALIVTFFVCWFPYHVFSFIDLNYSSHLDMMVVVNTGVPIASCLAIIHSCVNPILYVFMAKGYKDSLKRSLFSAFENAFTEEVRQTSTTNKTKSSTEMELQL